MKRQIESYLNQEQRLKGALIGISIREAETGKQIYEYMGDTRLHPASNMKLLTAAASLSVLGENYRFSTELYTDGTVEKEIVAGNLYLVGKGDPTLLPETFCSFAFELKTLGIKHISGDIVGDDTWYDKERLAKDVIWSDEQYYYAAQISALTVSPDTDYDAGSIYVAIRPEKYGEKAAVTISPETAYVQLENNTLTGQETDIEDLIIERNHGENVIKLSGRIPKNGEMKEEWIAVWEPTGYALDMFQQALKEHGITWSGMIRYGQVPDTAKLLYRHASKRLAEIIIPFMKLSNNTIAEVLIKEMGKTVYGEGSWEKGIHVLNREIQKLGLKPDTMVIRDGSGISHVNLIPASEITKLLYTVQQAEWFSAFEYSLPLAGAVSRMVGGTLQNRMQHVNVRAKTGTIDGVSTLSGYLKKRNGEKLIFSILINNLLDEDEGKDIEDKIIDLVNHVEER